MCVLCSQTWVDDHWADAAASPAGDEGDIVILETHAARRGQRLRDRAARARICNDVLSLQGLTLQDWEGSSFILRDAKGRSAVVPHLAGVWEEAERLAGQPLDPLDPALLERLHVRAGGAASEL